MASTLPRLTLSPGREKSLLRRHPWIFKGAVRSVSGDPQAGDTLEVRAHDGRWLAWAAYSPASQIVARVWSFDRSQSIDAAWLRARLTAAVGRRGGALAHPSTGCRLVFGESDGLPGVIVDRYGSLLVLQLLSAGAERWRDAWIEGLHALFPQAALYERSDASVREKEGLPSRVGPLSGASPDGPVTIQEGPARFLVDVRSGHKTGFYLDQRPSRAWVRDHARGASVLNVFCYTGAFGVVAGLGGAASVTQIDSSSDALRLAAENLRENSLPAPDEGLLRGDAFSVVRDLVGEGRRFDLVILDPPKFIESKAQMAGGTRGYKDINRVALGLVNPGGRLLTFSCSGLLDAALFQKIVADAALDAGREARIVDRLFQGEDHPTLLSFPEASYLKGLVLRVD